MTDPLLDRLAAEGFALDVREPVVDVEATLRKLKRAKVEVRGLPWGKGASCARYASGTAYRRCGVEKNKPPTLDLIGENAYLISKQGARQ